MEEKTYAQEEENFFEKLIEPDMYNVILINDDVTPMDFVILVLISIFDKTESQAEQEMNEAHNTGEVSIGVYAHDIAVTKTKQVAAIAEKETFPLKCRIEKYDN